MDGMGIKTVLVTGSEGYIGSVLVPMLLERGYAVVGLDAQFYGTSGNSGYTMKKSDIRNITKEDLKGIDAIIHLAALSNDPMGALNEKLTEIINYEASVRLAVLAKEAGVRRFLFSSSCSIYGISESGLVSENGTLSPLTAYARSKIATEKELTRLADDGFTVGLLRNSTVYGYSPKFRDDLVVNNFVTTALSTGEIKVKSDGSPWRPLIDVRDLSSVFIAFLEADPDTINGMPINVGFMENNVQVKDVLALVKRALPSCTVTFTGEHGADTRSYKVDFGKFRGIFPHIVMRWGIYDSIVDMIESLRKNKFATPEYGETTLTRIKTLESLLANRLVDENLFWSR